MAKLCSAGPPRDAQVIWDLTTAEVDKGFCAAPQTQRELNRLYGVGQWRPIHRFVAHQADGKVRSIDDGKRGGQNDASRMVETIRCISLDFIPTICTALQRMVATPWKQQGWSGSRCAWLCP